MTRSQILLRLPPQLADQIAQRARAEGQSINTWAGRALSTALSNSTTGDVLAQRVTQLETAVAALLADEGDTHAVSPDCPGSEVIDFGRVVSFRE